MTVRESVEPADSVREQRRVALLVAAVVIALAFLVYVAIFDVSTTVEWVIFAAVVLAVIAAMGVAHFLLTPTRQLPHPDKVRREQRHAAMLSGDEDYHLGGLPVSDVFNLDAGTHTLGFQCHEVLPDDSDLVIHQLHIAAIELGFD